MFAHELREGRVEFCEHAELTDADVAKLVRTIRDKSSFCFPFRMATSKQGKSGDYLVLVGDWKGGLMVKLFRRGAEPDGDDRHWIEFVEEEFSREDFRFLVNYLDGYLEAFEENYREQIVVEAPDFLHDFEGAQVLYGYKGGRPFEHEFEDGDEYQKMRARLLEELGDWKARLVANLEWHRAAYSTFTIATIAKELGVGAVSRQEPTCTR